VAKRGIGGMTGLSDSGDRAIVDFSGGGFLNISCLSGHFVSNLLCRLKNSD